MSNEPRALPVADSRRARLRDDLPALFLALVFVLLAWPLAGDVTRYHSDERFYTDASIRMLEQGDFAAPEYADGTPRGKKPLLSYWLIAASYATFGIGVLQSRLPFLLAGGVLVWATWRSALCFLGDRRAALVAALMVGSSASVFTLATRSTPDVFVTLFAALALHGFGALLVLGQGRALHRAQGWIGTGLAVAIKGGLGLLIVAHAAIFRWFPSGRRAHARAFATPWVLVGLALALGALVPMLLGTEAAGVLLDDQVSGRLGLSPLEVLANAAQYLADLLRALLPWSLFVAAGFALDRPLLARLWRERRPLYVFVLLWTGVLVAVFSFANLHRARYLAPVLPWLSIAAAPFVVELWERGRCARFLRASVATFALVIALGCAAFALWLPSGFPRGMHVGLALVGVLALALFLATLLRGREHGLVALGLALLSMQSVALAILRPSLDVSPAPALAARLRELGIGGREVATVGIHGSIAGQIRVLSGARLDPITRPAGTPPGELAAFDALILPSPPDAEFDALGLSFEPCGFAYSSWKPREILSCRTSEDVQTALASHRQSYYLGVRESKSSR